MWMRCIQHRLEDPILETKSWRQRNIPIGGCVRQPRIVEDAIMTMTKSWIHRDPLEFPAICQQQMVEPII